MSAPDAAVSHDDEAVGERRRGLPLAFAVTWISYAAYYLGRKGISVAKATIGSELGKSALYGVETVYLAAYAIGQYASGLLGDRVGARRLIGVGMLVSAAACAAFGAFSGSVGFLLAFAVNGLAQSSGWPGNIKAMAQWTTRERRGAVMGFWATCYQVGGIAATAIAARMMVRFGWRGAFWGPALVMGLVAVLVLATLRAPKLPLEERPRDSAPPSRPAEVDTDAAAQRRVLKSSTVWLYGCSYFCIKLIRYSFLLWLPFYLEVALHYDKTRAADFSTSFEIGGVVGTIALGALSDRVRSVRRSVFAAASLVGLAGALLLYAKVGATSAAANFGVMALVGALLFGPDSVLSGAAAQDAGGPRAAAVAAGVINGVGSAGAVLQELVTRGVSEAWGWNVLFYVFVALALTAAVVLVPTFREAKRARA